MDTEALNAGTAAAKLPLALLAPKAIVARDLQIQVKIGHAIREHRLRDHHQLNIARQEKQEWVQRCTELLCRAFNQSSPAELFNNWVPTILPDYAEFGMFVEIFDEELRHRLNQLKAIIKSLRAIPDPNQSTTTTKGDAMATETTIATGATAVAPNTMNAAPAAPVITQAMQAAQAQAALRTQALRSTTNAPGAAPRSAGSDNAGMLIVRTSDDAACEAVRQFVEQLGLSLHVSKRAANAGANNTSADTSAGNTVVSATPLLDELAAMQASPASFALLFTASPDQPHDSGDPDALFDLGCCVGKLGAARVIVLHRGGEAHTDRFGLTHVVFDNGEGWQLQLAKHLKRGGVDVDLNKLI